MTSIEQMTNLPVLSSLLLLPLLGAAVIWMLPRAKAKAVALVTLIVALAPALMAVIGLDAANPDFQFTEQYPWIPALDA
ncbi:MAG: NADH-quinone oxidoreductase subunit M, partial [Candidatus Thiodiazotropha sp. (ex Notomyrtea botanica)]|nr:NADH-quinone oxidoreductase subunit M [Candidatus Thiodiazotropha sp. (ex Notomyrtea botanica)]